MDILDQLFLRLVTPKIYQFSVVKYFLKPTYSDKPCFPLTLDKVFKCLYQITCHLLPSSCKNYIDTG